ncbi:cupin [Novosphingobium sp. M1R2S20]|uniref:Cupin n=1 Tax=Novosphingobium rhizovicinum TaxID=3228928 RepID=A0ABV3RCA7_9SPHN
MPSAYPRQDDLVDANDLSTHPVHLGSGGKAVPQPPFTGAEWYESYAARVTADGPDGRLVSVYDFSEDWEMHPAGDELVVCLEGEITLIQERLDGSFHAETLRPYQYAVNAAGVWHTANVSGSARALFITSGLGTEHRSR